MRAVIEALEGLSNKRLARGVLWDEGRRCGCLIGYEKVMAKLRGLRELLG